MFSFWNRRPATPALSEPGMQALGLLVRRTSSMASAPLPAVQILHDFWLLHLLYLRRRGTPLSCDTFEAWQHGPICPDAFHALRNTQTRHVLDTNGPDPAFLKTLHQDLNAMPAHTRRSLVMNPQGPVEALRQKRGTFAKISLSIMQAESRRIFA